MFLTPGFLKRLLDYIRQIGRLSVRYPLQLADIPGCGRVITVAPLAGQAQSISMLITTNGGTVSTNRWKYGAVPAVRNATGWQPMSNPPFTLDGTSTFALNGVEAPNGSSGISGGGYDLGALSGTGTFSLKPIGIGCQVNCFIGCDTSGNVCYSFTVANGVDGHC